LIFPPARLLASAREAATDPPGTARALRKKPHSGAIKLFVLQRALRHVTTRGHFAGSTYEACAAAGRRERMVWRSPAASAAGGS